MASPFLLAAAGQVGGDFFKERTRDTLPCQAQPDHVFCFDWAKENIDRYGTPTVQHLEIVVLSVVIGFAVAFALAVLAHRRRRLQPPLLAATGVLYTIPSLANGPDAVKDAARGVGLTERQILWRVELPLAIPEIVAGLRVAVVSTIANETLVVFINAGGLGTQMYGSGNLTFPTSIIIAAAIVMTMALAFDLVLLTAQRLATPWRRVRPA